jgi:hypothetical protein
METVTVTIDQFIRANRISMTAERWHENPSMLDSANMDHWKCALRSGNKRMTVYFSMGYGHNGKAPKVADVLDCLSSDASGIENARSFEDWCSEYGYDTDSRKAEKTFKTCEHQAKRLSNFLGSDAFQTLLWHTEGM